MSRSSWPVVLLRPMIVLTLGLAVACSDSEAPGADGPQDTVADGTAPSQPTLPEEELGDLAREDLGLTLPWTVGQITRSSDTSAAPGAVRAIRFDRVAGLDRMTLELDPNGVFPGYVVDSSIYPLPRCASADSVRSEGPGLLRIRLQNASVADEVDAAPLDDAGLDNVQAIHTTCRQEGRLEWVLDVRRATSYRVLEASDPPRLVVDVNHELDERPAGAPAPGG